MWVSNRCSKGLPDDPEAVDNATSGALILMPSSVYKENVVINGKTEITIEGELGIVIKGYMYVHSSSSMVLKNLTINAGSTGILIYKSDIVTVEKCNLTYTGTDPLKPPRIYMAVILYHSKGFRGKRL